MEPSNLQDAIRKLRGGNKPTQVRSATTAPKKTGGFEAGGKPNVRMYVMAGLALAVVAITIGWFLSTPAQELDRLNKDDAKKISQPAPANDQGVMQTGGVRIHIKPPDPLLPNTK